MVITHILSIQNSYFALYHVLLHVPCTRRQASAYHKMLLCMFEMSGPALLIVLYPNIHIPSTATQARQFELPHAWNKHIAVCAVAPTPHIGSVGLE